jgi:hypothetical protein
MNFIKNNNALGSGIFALFAVSPTRVYNSAMISRLCVAPGQAKEALLSSYELHGTLLHSSVVNGTRTQRLPFLSATVLLDVLIFLCEMKLARERANLGEIFFLHNITLFSCKNTCGSCYG